MFLNLFVVEFKFSIVVDKGHIEQTIWAKQHYYSKLATVRKIGRRGDLKVSALDSGSSHPGSGALAEDVVSCTWARHFTLTVPLSAQMYKWVPPNLVLGVTLQWTSIPPSGRVEKLSVASCYWEPEISAGLLSHLACMQTLLIFLKDQFILLVIFVENLFYGADNLVFGMIQSETWLTPKPGNQSQAKTMDYLRYLIFPWLANEKCGLFLSFNLVARAFPLE